MTGHVCSPRAWRLIVALVGAAVLAGYLAHVAYFWPHINDDAFITFRYSRFLALGRGPYFNPGEHVEGYTNFSLMLLMAGFIHLFGPDDVLLAAKLTGAAGGIAAILAAWALCTRWLRQVESCAAAAPLVGWAAGAIVAADAAFALNSTTGLETTLFAAAIALGLWLDQKARDQRRWRGAGLLYAFGALTRPEGAGVFAAVALARLVTLDFVERPRRRALLLDLGIVAVFLAGHLTFRLAVYDGEWLPNTYYAKAGGFWKLTPTGYISGYAQRHLGAVLALLPLLAMIAGPRQLRNATLPALLVLVAAVGAIFAAGPDWMLGYRLLAPYTPVWAALAVCGLVMLLARLRVPRAGVTVGAAALVLLLAVWQAPTRVGYHEHVVTRAQGYRTGHRALARWLNRNASPGQTVALMDIGIVGYECIDLRILDITGLTDRCIARSPGEFLHKDFDPAYVLGQRPEFLVLVFTGPIEPGQIDIRNLQPWTPIEERIFESPDFARHYFRQRPVPRRAGMLKRLAAMIGAEAVFSHAHPGNIHYLLAVYRRADAAAPAEPGE